MLHSHCSLAHWKPGGQPRSKSELIREALRRYIQDAEWRDLRSRAESCAQGMGIRSEEDVNRLVEEHRRQQRGSKSK
jgi:Arc/MetJ-type ribon-helix-helix transcriptional regulator